MSSNKQESTSSKSKNALETAKDKSKVSVVDSKKSSTQSVKKSAIADVKLKESENADKSREGKSPNVENTASKTKNSGEKKPETKQNETKTSGNETQAGPAKDNKEDGSKPDSSGKEETKPGDKDGEKKADNEVKKEDTENKAPVASGPPKVNQAIINKPIKNLKMAGKWGAAVEKASPTTKKAKKKGKDEIDPFLAKFAMARTRRNTLQKPADGENKRDDEEEEDEEDIKWWKQPHFTWPYWRDYVIDPAEPLWFYWSLIAALAVFYNLVCVFLRAVFTELAIKEYETSWLVADYISDFITILDMFVRCRLGFLEQGILVVDKKRLMKTYVKSFKFPVDLVSILPLDLFYLLTGVNTLLRLNRILRIWRVQEFYHDSETRTTFPNGFRMAFLIVSICLMIHWNACIYYSMSKALGFGSDEWAYDQQRPGFDKMGMRYLFSFYWSMLTLTAIGDTNPPESIPAMMYCVIVTLCGVLIFATIFGNVGAMINQMNASRQEFQQNVDAVKRYMDIRKVSPVLQDRVIQWFAYTWNNKQSVDDKQALTILPEKLRAEIAIQVHLDTLKRVAIFKDCEPGLLQELVLKLRLQVFSPGDYICRKGDIGKEMYIIKRGKLQVVSPDGKVVFVTMQDGAVFGEVSILNIAGNKTGNRRTASVRSLGYSDLFCLSKDDLWDALKEYPEAKMMLWEKGKQILRKDNLLDEEAARRKELEDMSMDTKIDHINNTMETIGKKVGMLAENILLLQKHLGLTQKDEEEKTEEPKK